ncbi:MAG TPA: SCO family protein [Solirubrobacteraceae bacterium]|jgi:protein SCO1/2
MRQRSRIILLAVATAIVLALALVVLLDHPTTQPSTDSTTAAAAAARAVAENAQASTGFDGALLPKGVRAPDFTLTDQAGRRVSPGQYRGRVTILTFLSTTCHPTCPLIAQQIRGALDELSAHLTHAHPVPVLIVSADPAADTPAAVRRFLDEAALDGRVEYLTGTPAELRAVWRAYGIVPSGLGDAESPHAAAVLLIDRAGQKRDLFQVEQLTPEGLVHDIRKLEGER